MSEQVITSVDPNEFNDWDLAAQPAVIPSSNPLLAKEDTSYLDEFNSKTDTDPLTEQTEETILNAQEANQILDSLATDPVENQPITDEQPKTSGKSALVDFMAEQIETGNYLNYNDYKEGEDLKAYLSKLTVEDLKGLHNENLNRIKQEESSKGPQEFLQNLSPVMQQAIYYDQQGINPVPYLQAASQLEDITNINLEEESAQEYIVRTHLTNSNFGTPDEVAEEVQNIKDLGQLETRAKKFHPHLVKQDQQRVQQLEQQAAYETQQRELQYKQYTDGIYQALAPAELAGIKLDKKTQESLYYGLTTTQFPDRNNNATNELGYLLDKHQFVEPNYAILAEVTLMLRDPEAYREKIRQQGANTNTEKVVRELKTEQARSLQPQEYSSQQTTQKAGIPRKGNIFQRPKQ